MKELLQKIFLIMAIGALFVLFITTIWPGIEVTDSYGDIFRKMGF